MITYEVKISRQFVKSKLECFIQGEYWWNVDARINGSYESSLSECGWSRTLNQAKAQALKHILSAEKKIGDGEQFGVVFSVDGAAEKVIEKLQ